MNLINVDVRNKKMSVSLAEIKRKKGCENCEFSEKIGSSLVCGNKKSEELGEEISEGWICFYYKGEK